VVAQPRALTVVAVFGLLALVVTPAGAYEVAAVQDGGSVSGSVKLVGALPKLDPLVVKKSRDVCGERRASEALVLPADKRVKGAVVLLQGVARGKKGVGDVILDTAGCVFVSHVTAVGPTDRVSIRNSDSILHNPHGVRGLSTVFNVALPGRGQVIEVTKYLKSPGVIRVRCDAHPHMSAWLVVHDSPYVAVTDDAGTFSIGDVPPGTYKITMWHAGFRPSGKDRDGRPTYDEPRAVTRTITVAPKAAATVDFELK
jgi:plastocyanin